MSTLTVKPFTLETHQEIVKNHMPARLSEVNKLRQYIQRNRDSPAYITPSLLQKELHIFPTRINSVIQYFIDNLTLEQVGENEYVYIYNKKE